MLKNCRYQAHTVFGEVERHLREMKSRLRPQQNDQSKKEKNNPKAVKVEGRN